MKQVITLSDNAASRIKEILSNDETKSIGVRVWCEIRRLCWYVIHYGVYKRN